MSKKCARCEKAVYPLEELKCLDKIWHKGCFKCQECGMTLSMKTYKGFNKLPYCEAHIPKAKATTVAETPEMRRLAENTKIQSNVQYHADFEKNKAKFTQVADDPETQRLKKNTQIISNVVYHGELAKKSEMERKRGEPGDENEDWETWYGSHGGDIATANATAQSTPLSHLLQNNDEVYDDVENMPVISSTRHDKHLPRSHQYSPTHGYRDDGYGSHLSPNADPQGYHDDSYNYRGSPGSDPQRYRDDPHSYHPSRGSPNPDPQGYHDDEYNYRGSPGSEPQRYYDDPHGYHPSQGSPGSDPGSYRDDAFNYHPSRGSPGSSSDARYLPEFVEDDGYYPPSPHSQQTGPNDYYPGTNRPGPPPHDDYSTNNYHPMSQQPGRRVGSIADYDPVNEQYGSIASHNANPSSGYRQETTYQVQRTNLYGDKGMGGPQQPPPQHNSNQVPPGHHKVNAPPTQLGRCYRAMYDYEAADTDEVSFRDGDLIINCTAIDEGWMTGTIQRTGVTGMLPANYVERVS